MDDLISRQTAVDAILKKARAKNPDMLMDILLRWSDGIKDAIRAVIDTPPSTCEWLHELLQAAIDDGIITEVQAVRIMERVKT